MFKQTLKHTIREFLPAGIVLAVSFFIFGTSGVLFNSVSYGNIGLFAMSFSTWGVLLAIAVMLFAYQAMSYRFTVSSTDFYGQAPFNIHTIRRMRLLVGLIYVLASFIIVYLLSFALGFIINSHAPTTDRSGAPLNSLNFLPVLGALLFYLAYASFHYFITAFILSLSDDLYTAFVITALFIFVLSINVGPIVVLVRLIGFGDYNYFYNYFFSGSFNVSPFSLGGMADQLFKYNLYFQPNTVLEDIPTLVFMITRLAVIFLLGIGSIAYVFLKRDPSGEYSERTLPRNRWIALIPHIAIIVGICALVAFAGATAFVLIWLFGALTIFMIYLTLALARRTFKIPSFDWIGAGIDLVIAFAAYFVTFITLVE